MTDIEKPDIVGAHRRAESIRQGLRSFIETRALITEAFENNDWITLGYNSWQAYCDREFGVKQLRLTKEERIEAALAFKDAGMTLREIAAATGTSPATAMRDLGPAVSDETKEAQVKDPLAEIPAAERAVDEFINNQTSGTAADRSDDGPGEDHTDEDASGTAARDASSAQPEVPGVALGSAPAEQEEPASSPPVDEPREAALGVTLPPSATPLAAAPVAPAKSFAEYMTDPVVTIATVAELYGGLDIEIVGPKLSDADMEAIEASATVIKDVVKLLRLWQSRPAEGEAA